MITFRRGVSDAPDNVVVDEHEAAVQRIQMRVTSFARKENEQDNKRRVDKKRFVPVDYKVHLRQFNQSTLLMMENHSRIADLNHGTMKWSEGRIRSALRLSQLSTRRRDPLPLHVADAALASLYAKHNFSRDVTSLDADEQAKIVAGCDLIIDLGLMRRRYPMALTALVMSNPDRLDDIITYVRQRSTVDTVSDINVQALQEYIDMPVPSLRDGTL